MNIASGQSSIKEHLSNGSRTACNKKISFGKLDKVQFAELAKAHPEKCCQNCLKKLK